MHESDSLLGLYSPIEGVRLNLVHDTSGAVFGKNGTSDDITNQLDRQLLVELRRQSDVVVTTGKTARIEGIRRSKFAPLVIVTETPSLIGYSSELLQPIDDSRSLTFFTRDSLAPELSSEVADSATNARVIGISDLEPVSVLGQLRLLGYKRILLESGPTVSQLWLKQSCVDEVCLTTTGTDTGDSNLDGLPVWLSTQKFSVTSRYQSKFHRALFRRLKIIR